MARALEASLRGEMRMSVRSRAVSRGRCWKCCGKLLWKDVRKDAGLPAYRHFMNGQIVHLGKGARAADFG